MKIIKSYWQRCLVQRFRLVNNKRLTHRDILIFVHREGYLYIILILITFIAGINYANNLILALCFLLISILVLSFYLAFKQLYGLKLQINAQELGQINQPLKLNYQVSPLKNYVHLHLRFEFEQQYKKISILKITEIISFTVLPKARGRYQIERLYFYSVYPFALVKAWSLAYPNTEIWIAPEAIMVNLQHYGFRSSQLRTSGIEDFSHLREFQSGDGLNRVAWQQYAKGKGLLVKQFEQYQEQALNFNYIDMTLSLHEQKLGQLMYLVEQAYQQHYAFSLQLPTQFLEYGHGDEHFFQAKLMLAKEP